MSDAITRVGMKPCHPGEFIREEIMHELHLPVARAAEILGVRRATLSDLVNGKAALSPEMALRRAGPAGAGKAGEHLAKQCPSDLQQLQVTIPFLSTAKRLGTRVFNRPARGMTSEAPVR